MNWLVMVRVYYIPAANRECNAMNILQMIGFFSLILSHSGSLDGQTFTEIKGIIRYLLKNKYKQNTF